MEIRDRDLELVEPAIYHLLGCFIENCLGVEPHLKRGEHSPVYERLNLAVSSERSCRQTFLAPLDQVAR